MKLKAGLQTLPEILGWLLALLVACMSLISTYVTALHCPVFHFVTMVGTLLLVLVGTIVTICGGVVWLKEIRVHYSQRVSTLEEREAMLSRPPPIPRMPTDIKDRVYRNLNLYRYYQNESEPYYYQQINGQIRRIR